MFKLGDLIKGSGELVFLDHFGILWLFKLGGLAKGSGELIFIDDPQFK